MIRRELFLVGFALLIGAPALAAPPAPPAPPAPGDGHGDASEVPDEKEVARSIDLGGLVRERGHAKFSTTVCARHTPPGFPSP